MPILRALSLLLWLWLALAPARAQDAAKIAITPESPRAAIILKAADLPRAPTYRTSYRIHLQTYDPQVQTLRGGPFGGSITFAARPKAFVDGYLVVDVKPGTYAFRDFSRQDYWALCFNGGSRHFTVKPGELLYLGEMDVVRHAAELERTAMMTGQMSTSGKLVHFFDNVTPPILSPVGDAELAAVAAMVRARMPRTSVAPKAAQFGEARFGTGSDLFGLDRVCGGYFSKRAK